MQPSQQEGMLGLRGERSLIDDMLCLVGIHRQIGQQQTVLEQGPYSAGRRSDQLGLQSGPSKSWTDLSVHPYIPRLRLSRSEMMTKTGVEASLCTPSHSKAWTETEAALGKDERRGSGGRQLIDHRKSSWN